MSRLARRNGRWPDAGDSAEVVRNLLRRGPYAGAVTVTGAVALDETASVLKHLYDAFIQFIGDYDRHCLLLSSEETKGACCPIQKSIRVNAVDLPMGIAALHYGVGPAVPRRVSSSR